MVSASAFAQSPPTHVIIDQLPVGRPPVRHAIDDCADPAGKTSGEIAKGENLINALRSDEGLVACNDALQTKCSLLRQQAQLCATRAIQEKQTLSEVSQQLGTIDFYLASYKYDDAEGLAEQLRKVQCKAEPCSYQEYLRTYVGIELEKKIELKERPWPYKWRGRLGRLFGIVPSPPLRTWASWFFGGVLWVLKWLLWFILAVIVVWLSSWAFGALWNRRKRLLEQRSWIVWSVVDASDSGAAGAIMDALDWEANPLLRNDSGDRRLMCWLAPPFLPDDDRKSAQNTAAVWSNLLSGSSPVEPELWNLSESLEKARGIVGNLFLDPAYQELDVEIGGFALKGLNGARKFVLQSFFREVPSIIGVVTRRELGKFVAWGVRLNANRLDKREEQAKEKKRTITVSVFAESLPQEYGDPLAQVAQRAALKLMLRLAGSDATQSQSDANVVTAQAAYRQGIELLQQLI